MPVLNIGDVQIQVETVQRTTPSLKFMDDTGQIYYVGVREGACPNSLKVSDGNKTYTVGDSTLYFSATSVNSCDTVTLEPGCYNVQIRGGRGGDGGNNAGSGMDGVVQSYNFTIDTETVATYFRGGNGNAGAVKTNSSVYSGGGGGASGADSMFAINGVVTIANGGQGGAGGSGTNYNGVAQNCGGGGGGGTDGDANANGMNGTANSSLDNSFILCGGGGGGAPSGTGGTGESSGGYSGGDGADATSNTGGTGGNAARLFSSGSGGAGGATVTYSCAGQTLYSYGGGGGGATHTGAWSTRNVNGGAGGSGASSTQSAGIIEIYRFE